MKHSISLKEAIYRYFLKREANGFVNGGVIEEYALNAGFKASNASRRLRELCNEGLLERKINGRSVEYRSVEYKVK